MKTGKFNRVRHLVAPTWAARRQLSKAARERITQAIRASETRHRGELRFVAEGALPLGVLRAATTVRARAVDVFSELRVWDTEENTGVLIYLQLVDRDFEIVADRGINARVAQVEWDAIAARMKNAFRAGEFESGVLAGLAEITALLTREFPARAQNPNELPDEVIVR
jgi:uncharacterized membrane protein